MINLESTLRTAPDLRENVPLAVLYGINGNSYTFYTQSDMCVCVCVCVCVCACVCVYTHTHTHTHSSQYRDAGRGKDIKIKIETTDNAACHFGPARHSFSNSVIGQSTLLLFVC